MHHERYCAAGDARPSGFVPLAVSEHDGELEYAIEITERVTGCPVCSVVARLHDRRRTDVRDLSAGALPVTLVWIMRDESMRVSQERIDTWLFVQTSSWT